MRAISSWCGGGGGGRGFFTPGVRGGDVGGVPSAVVTSEGVSLTLKTTHISTSVCTHHHHTLLLLHFLFLLLHFLLFLLQFPIDTKEGGHEWGKTGKNSQTPVFL
jgi:hypothetical protein